MSGRPPRSTQYGKKIYLPLSRETNVNSRNSISPYFGQPVIKEEEKSEHINENVYKDFGYSNNKIDSSFSSLSDIESWDTGSTSSSSWFDEFDKNSTSILNNELNNIELVLYGEADISILKPELRNECQEWKDAFPHLRITGSSVNFTTINVQNQKSLPDFKIKNTIQNQKSSKAFSVLSTTDSYYNRDKSESIFSNALKKNNSASTAKFETESFIRITPSPAVKTPSLEFERTISKPYSVTSLIRAEKSSTKWQEQQARPNDNVSSPEEYSSLPFIITSATSGKHGGPTWLNNQSNKILPTTSFENSRKYLGPMHQDKKPHERSIKSSINYYQTLPTRSLKPLILPPIDQISLINSSSNNFRSISATPRNILLSNNRSEFQHKKVTSIESKQSICNNKNGTATTNKNNYN